MKLLLLLSVCLVGFTAQAQSKYDGITFDPNAKVDTSKKSIKAIAFAKMQGDSVQITYHSPGVRGRVIWGGLVAYNDVWVTGAHDATLLDVRNNFIVNDTKIPAGKYALFTIPGKDEWTIIINKNYNQHLTWDYAEADDVVRIKVKPLQNPHTERLQYFITPTNAKAGTISIAWEKLKVEFPFTLAGK